MDEILKNYDFIQITKDTPNLFLKEVAIVLTDAFRGIQVGTQFIQEPMIKTLKLDRDALIEFNYQFLKEHQEDGLSFAAVDIQTNRVIGGLSCEAFHMYEENEVFPKGLENFKDLVIILKDINEQFIKSIQVQDDSFDLTKISHAFMLGVVTEYNKKYIGAELMRRWIEESKKQGYKKVFVEATNKRSQQLMRRFFGFKESYYQNVKIEHIYESCPIFNTIPKEISSSCEILYQDL